MVERARRRVPGAEEIRLLTLPDDPIPAADAVVSVGHVLNYLPDEAAVDRALVAAARAGSSPSTSATGNGAQPAGMRSRRCG